MTQEQYALNLTWLKSLAKNNVNINTVLVGILNDFYANRISFREYLLKVKNLIS